MGIDEEPNNIYPIKRKFAAGLAIKHNDTYKIVCSADDYYKIAYDYVATEPSNHIYMCEDEELVLRPGDMFSSFDGTLHIVNKEIKQLKVSKNKFEKISIIKYDGRYFIVNLENELVEVKIEE
jgi:hypothetical protein